MKPSYCPSCGQLLPEGSHGAQPASSTETGDGLWDCYCDKCHWSGDIYPDSERGMYETKPPFEVKHD